MRRVPILMLAVVALALAACGSDDDEATPPPPPPATETETETAGGGTTETDAEPAPGATSVVVYLLADGRVQPVRRTVAATRAVARAALEQLIAGTTAREAEVGLSSEVPQTTAIERLAIEDGVATVDLRPCPPMAQVVFTLTQFPTVRSVAGGCPGGRRLTRAAFEGAAPAILVESPLLDDEVRSPLRLRGSANTFEATFQINLVDWDGRIVEEQFATATSGSGTRGTFDVSIPFEVDRPGGALIVFEQSAKDGSQINVVEIPLQLQP